MGRSSGDIRLFPIEVAVSHSAREWRSDHDEHKLMGDFFALVSFVRMLSGARAGCEQMTNVS